MFIFLRITSHVAMFALNNSFKEIAKNALSFSSTSDTIMEQQMKQHISSDTGKDHTFKIHQQSEIFFIYIFLW